MWEETGIPTRTRGHEHANSPQKGDGANHCTTVPPLVKAMKNIYPSQDNFGENAFNVSPARYSLFTHQGCIFDQAHANLVPLFKSSKNSNVMHDYMN